MAIYFGTERCDGAKDATSNVSVKTYYTSETGVKVATVNDTDVYAPYEALPDVTVTPYYNSSTGVKIATVSGKDVYSPTSFSEQTGNMIVGAIMPWAGNGTIPTGWLLCDGSEVSKSLYNDLYQVIRDDFGTPKNSSNFVLPNIADARYLQGNTKSGTKIEAGLPNITGSIDGSGATSGTQYEVFGETYTAQTKATGAYSGGLITGDGYAIDESSAGHGNNKLKGWNFNASKSNSIYGNSTTVTPTSMTVRYLICWKNMILNQMHVAMPDWQSSRTKDIKALSHKSAGSGYTCTEAGYVLFYQTDDGKSGIAWSASINGIQVFYTARSSASAWENTNLVLIPVAKGDVVLIDGTYPSSDVTKVLFIPCREIQEHNIVGGHINASSTLYELKSLIASWTTCTASAEGFPFSSSYDPGYTLASLIITVKNDCFANIRVNIDNSDSERNADGHSAIVMKTDSGWKVIAEGATSHWGGGATVSMPLVAGMLIRAFCAGYGNKLGGNGGSEHGLFLSEYIPDQYTDINPNDASTSVIDGTLLCDKTVWTGILDTSAQLMYTVKNDCGLMIKELEATSGGDNQAYTTCYYTDKECTKPIYSHGESYTSYPESYGSMIHLKKGTTVYARLEHALTVRFTTKIEFYEYKLFSTDNNVLNHVGSLITYDGGTFQSSASVPAKDIYTATEDCAIFVHVEKDDIGSYGSKNYLFIKVNGVIAATACDPGLGDNRQREISWQGSLYKGDVVSICVDDVSYGQVIYSYNVNKLAYSSISSDDNETPLIDWTYTLSGFNSGCAAWVTGGSVQWRYDNQTIYNLIYNPGRYARYVYPLKEDFTNFDEIRVVYGDYSGGSPDICAKTFKSRDLDWLLKLPLNSSCTNIHSVLLPNSYATEYTTLLCPYNGSANYKFNTYARSTTKRLISYGNYAGVIMEIYGINRKNS